MTADGIRAAGYQLLGMGQRETAHGVASAFCNGRRCYPQTRQQQDHSHNSEGTPGWPDRGGESTFQDSIKYKSNHLPRR